MRIRPRREALVAEMDAPMREATRLFAAALEHCDAHGIQAVVSMFRADGRHSAALFCVDGLKESLALTDFAAEQARDYEANGGGVGL